MHRILRSAWWIAFLLGFAGIPLSHAQTANDDCAAPHRIVWPADHPVWSLCWIAPDSSSGIDGSGIELRDVYYKGKLVLRRAGIPVLNVNYDPGGCGSLRDWQNVMMDFESDGFVPPPGSRYAEPTKPPRTMCDHPGTDKGDFEGVAAQKTPSELVLTTQLQAGPYRYTQKWIFRLDGSIDARLGFTAVVEPCNVKPHNHHAYWRLEFDIGGDGKDRVEEAGPKTNANAVSWSRFLTEASRRTDPVRGSAWRVRSESLQRGYEIISSPENGAADSWADADLWVLAFHPEEIDDGGARKGPGGNAVHLDQYLNDESVDGAKIVLWVHAMDRHAGSNRCRFVGPTLRPIGKW